MATAGPGPGVDSPPGVGGKAREGEVPVNKADLVSVLEDRLGGKKAAADAIEVVLDAIIREVARGGKVSLTGFGTFERVARAERTGRNPRTGETVKIKKTAVPKFKPGTSFRVVVADPRKLPKTSLAGGRAPAGTARARAAGKALPSRTTSGGKPTKP